MSFILDIIQIIQWILLIYFGIAAIYLLLFSLAGLFPLKVKYNDIKKFNQFAILIPGYKEDKVIVNTAKEALKQEYPSDKYSIIIIADSFEQKTLAALKELPILVIEVDFEISSKTNSLNKAMEILGDDYDGVIVLDADNIMEPGFIDKCNNAMNNGFQAIQGHRVAKNLNTNLAILDAISEEINNHIFRKGHRVLGLSSALIGSGMAFTYSLYKRLMKNIVSFAEDKELEYALFLERIKIEYIEAGFVYDEKVSKSDVFVKQRTRWIAFQILFAGNNLLKSTYHLLFKGNVDFFDKALQHTLPPRIILLGFTYIITILSIFLNNGILWWGWLATFFVINFSIIISIPKSFYLQKDKSFILSVPLGFILMVLTLFKLRSATKNFNPTPHSALREIDSYNEKNKQ